MKYIYIFLIVLVILIGFTTRFERDDYCYSVTSREGIMQATVNQYYTWSGRYSVFLTIHTTLQLNPKVSNGILLIITLAVMAWALYLNDLPVLGLLSLLVLSRPTDQLWFWGSGIASYTIPIAFSLIMMYCIKTNKQVLAFITAFIGIGYSELTAFYMLILLAYCVLIYRKFAIGACVGGSIGFILLFSAAGNSVRLSTQGEYYNLFESIQNTFANFDVTLRPVVIILLSMPVAIYLGTQFKDKLSIKKYGLVALFTLLSTIFIHYYLTSIFPPERVYGVVQVAIIAFFFALGTNFKFNWLKPVAIVFLTLGIVFTGIRLRNGVNYASYWDAREQVALSTGQFTLSTHDLDEWVQDCIKDYYYNQDMDFVN